MKRIIGILSLLFLNLDLSAQIETNELGGGDVLNTITTAVPFLLIGPDSRSGAMGDVGAATSPDAYSLHWNPAKFAFADNDLEMSVSYVPWLRALVPDINLSYIGGYKKLNENEAVGVELRYFSLGDITFTNITGDIVGQFKPNEFAVGTAYSRKLSDIFALAGPLRFLH